MLLRFLFKMDFKKSKSFVSGEKLILLLSLIIISCSAKKTIIHSEPPTAFVTINGISKGVTPLEVKLDCDEKKTFEVTVFLPGYIPQTKIINCRWFLGPKKNVFFELKPGKIPVNKLKPLLQQTTEGFGTIEIKSIPRGAKVFLNNSLIGSTPVIAKKVKSGSYILEVRKEGFKPWRKEIQISPKSKNKYFPILEEE